MPGVVSAMAEAAGFGTDETAVAKLMDAMQKGNVKSKDVLPKFAEILATRARQGGALTKAMESTAAQQARFNNAFSDAVKVFSAAGFDRSMGGIFKNMADAMNRAHPLIMALGSAFEYLVKPFNAVVTLLGDLGEHFGRLALWLGTSSDKLAVFSGGVLLSLTPLGRMVEVFSFLTLALEDFVTYLEGGDSLFGEWMASIDPQRAESIKSMGESLLGLAEAMKSFGELAIIGWQDIFGYFEPGSTIDTVISNITKISNGITALANALKMMRDGDFSGISEVAKNAGEGYVDRLLQFPGFKVAEYVKNEATDIVRGTRAWQSQEDRNKPVSQTAPVTPENPLAGLGAGLTKDQLRAQIADEVQKNQTNPPESKIYFSGDVVLNMPNATGDPLAIEQAAREAFSKVFENINSNQTEGEQ